MTKPTPPAAAMAMNARRTMSGSIPSSRASPAHTPATRRPSSARRRRVTVRLDTSRRYRPRDSPVASSTLPTAAQTSGAAPPRVRSSPPRASASRIEPSAASASPAIRLGRSARRDIVLGSVARLAAGGRAGVVDLDRADADAAVEHEPRGASLGGVDALVDVGPAGLVAEPDDAADVDVAVGGDAHAARHEHAQVADADLRVHGGAAGGEGRRARVDLEPARAEAVLAVQRARLLRRQARVLEAAAQVDVGRRDSRRAERDGERREDQPAQPPAAERGDEDGDAGDEDGDGHGGAPAEAHRHAGGEEEAPDERQRTEGQGSEAQDLPQAAR